ncbi:MAG: RNA-guided endonuclease InsQ/TnpB family protein, partial [Thermoplasmatota archaeon]
MRRTFECRLYPTPGQEVRMGAQLASCQRLYNAMLEQRRTAYRSHGVSLSRFDQEVEIKEVRTLPEYAAVYAHVVQDVARRVDLAFQAFFRRVKAGEKPGYPRFRARDRYDSLTYKQPGNGSVKLVGNRVSFSKLASNVKVRLHRPILGTMKAVTVKRKAGKWFVLFSCDNVPPDPTLVAGDGEVGIDVGLVSFATLSTGEAIQNPRYAGRAAAHLASAQRVLARRVRGSHRRQKARAIVARQHAHVAAKRRDHAFKVAHDLVTRFDRIGVEALEVRNMVQNRHLARSISDVSWGQFIGILECKAEEAGALVVRVNPRNSSQECSACGAVVPKPLSEREHRCSECGLVLGRDENAAINILHRARTEPSWRARNERPVEARS